MNPHKMRPCSAKQSSLSAPCIIPVVNNDDIFGQETVLPKHEKHNNTKYGHCVKNAQAKMSSLSIIIISVATFLDCDGFTYGPGCTSNCLCAQDNTDFCDAVNGTCICNDGWKGDQCQSSM